MNDDSEWMSISDMMSGLMLIFMFIAISFMIQVQDDKKSLEQSNNQLKILIQEAQKDKEKIENIAKTYYQDKIELNKALQDEFQDDLGRWKAEITKNNIIIFHSPKVLFKTGKSFIKNEFKHILDDFFPRYIKILSSNKYKNEIDEIRVEGHTSNDWTSKMNQSLIYLNNMKLSQNRANNVLSYCYSIDKDTIIENKEWLEKHFRANGMAFSKMRYLDINKSIPDLIKSKRVEFRIQMKTEDKIYNILKVAK